MAKLKFIRPALALLTLLIILYPRLSLAQSDEPAALQDLEPIFARVIISLVSLAGIALFFTLISGGFNWITSGGDTKRLTQAQNTITFAIVGFIVLSSAVLILQLVKQFTGVDVTIFRVRQ